MKYVWNFSFSHCTFVIADILINTDEISHRSIRNKNKAGYFITQFMLIGLVEMHMNMQNAHEEEKCNEID